VVALHVAPQAEQVEHSVVALQVVQELSVDPVGVVDQELPVQQVQVVRHYHQQ
jgi:hypothetical protein